MTMTAESLDSFAQLAKAIGLLDSNGRPNSSWFGDPIGATDAAGNQHGLRHSPRIPLPVGVDARMPRAVPIDVDLSDITTGHSVLFLAIVGSTVDPCSEAPVGLPATPRPADLARGWPYAALRLVRVSARPRQRPDC
jgi:hypothetical protein